MSNPNAIFSKVTEGDLLNEQEGFLLHGCNDKGVMGAGIAFAIRNKYPEAFNLYHEQYKEGTQAIGTCTFYRHNRKLWIVNAVTQTLGTANPLSYFGLAACFRSTLEFMRTIEQLEGQPIGSNILKIPQVGAGLAGGDWETICSLIGYELSVEEQTYRTGRKLELVLFKPS